MRAPPWAAAALLVVLWADALLAALPALDFSRLAYLSPQRKRRRLQVSTGPGGPRRIGGSLCSFGMHSAAC